MREEVKRGRFVVLEHAWNGVHWDLMLEAGGRLQTWAVDSPIKPGVELEARALADHRLEYLAYEGPISGDRGSVRRVDEGRFETIDWGPDQVRVRLQGVQLVGELTLNRSDSGEDSLTGSARWKLRLRGKVD